MAERIKEQFSYVCPDIVKEFKKYDQEGDKHFEKYQGIHSVTGQVCCDLLTNILKFHIFLQILIFFLLALRS